MSLAIKCGPSETLFWLRKHLWQPVATTCSAPQVSWWHHHPFFFEAYFRTESGSEPFCWVYNSNYKLIRANHSSKIIPPDFISLGQMFPDWYWLPYLKQLWTDKKLEKKFLWRRFDKIMFSDFFFSFKERLTSHCSS